MHSGISEISAAFSFTSLSLHSVVEHTILSVFAVSLHNMILALSSYLSSGFGRTGAHDFGSVFVARQFAVLPNVHLVFLISLLGCPVTYVWFLYVFLFPMYPHLSYFVPSTALSEAALSEAALSEAASHGCEIVLPSHLFANFSSPFP